MFYKQKRVDEKSTEQETKEKNGQNNDMECGTVWL